MKQINVPAKPRREGKGLARRKKSGRLHEEHDNYDLEVKKK